MKLIAQTYNSPNPLQGTFENVTIEDVSITHKRLDKYLSITFEMYYLKNDEKVVLDRKEVGFLGMELDEVSSNVTTTISFANPDYDPAIEDSKERTIAPLFAYLVEHQGELPQDYAIEDYGYPTYEKVMQYFEGGTLESPEIIISEPLAIGFLLSKLVMNGEPVGNQFTIV